VRWLLLAVACALILGGAALGLYGLFALLYGGDSGSSGETYVMLGGHHSDAQAVGAASLAIGLLALALGIMAGYIARPSRRPPRA
jgi:hypothetical protein